MAKPKKCIREQERSSKLRHKPLLEFMSDGGSEAPRKRLFIGLVAGTAFLLCLFGLVGYVIPYVGFGNIHPSIPFISGTVLGLIIICIVWATLGLVIQIVSGKRLWGGDKIHGLTIRCFLPLMVILGRILGFSQHEVQRSFIKVNNELSMRYEGSLNPDKILILVPHCLQTTECNIRVSHKIKECKRCGKCPISDLISLSEHYGCSVAVATGGSIARRIVVEKKPELIVAVACERDLSSGIQDTYPLPTFGILNSRPEGPCKNTLVSSYLIEKSLNFFIKPELLPQEKIFTHVS